MESAAAQKLVILDEPLAFLVNHVFSDKVRAGPALAIPMNLRLANPLLRRLAALMTTDRSGRWDTTRIAWC